MGISMIKYFWIRVVSSTMVSVLIVFTTVFLQVITAQNFNIQPCIQPPPNLVPPPAVFNEYSIELCKNLANTVQNLVLERLARNADRKPIFKQIAGPLLNDISIRSQGCPLCGTPVNRNQVLVNPCAKSQVVNQVAPVVNQVPQIFNQVPQVLNQVPQAVNQVPGLVNQVVSVNQGSVPYANIQNLRFVGNPVQAQPCGNVVQAAARPVVNQNVVQNQQYALVNGVKGQNGCGCGPRA